jgi:hypothetical protein
LADAEGLNDGVERANERGGVSRLAAANRDRRLRPRRLR